MSDMTPQDHAATEVARLARIVSNGIAAVLMTAVSPEVSRAATDLSTGRVAEYEGLLKEVAERAGREMGREVTPATAAIFVRAVTEAVLGQ